MGVEKALNPRGRLTLGIGTQEEVTVCRQDNTLRMTPEQQLEPGRYEQFFSIYLPAAIPPSMNYDDGHHGGCSVLYTLHATFGHHVVVKPLAVVGAPLSTKVYPYCEHPEIFPVRSLHIIDQGYVLMAAKVENTHGCRGRPIEFSLACRNRSKLDIHRVHVKAVETIHYRTKFHETKRNNVLADFPNVPLSGLQKDTSAKYVANQHLPTVVDALTHSEMHADLSSDQNRLCLTLPAKTHDSYQGKLVTVSHALHITLVLKETSHEQSNPTLVIPLRMYDPPLLETQAAMTLKHDTVIHEVQQTSWPDESALTGAHHGHSDSSGSYEAILEDLPVE